MKSFFKKLLIPLVCLSLTSCVMMPEESQSIKQSESEKQTESEKVIIEYSDLLPYDQFDLDTYMQPIWLGDTIYNETVVFVGKDDLGKLLYPVDEIISVTSYDLKTVYKEGTDYVFDEETNSILRAKDSTMPLFYKSEFYPEFGTYHSYTTQTGIFFSEGSTFSDKHIAVTYRTRKDDRITKPVDHSKKYENVINKMKNGEEVKICFYGDSITVGGNGSGFLGIEPNMPGFDVLVTESLKKMYNNPNIKCLNYAKGGEATIWGYYNVPILAKENPDLVIMSWGMNDNHISTEKFKSQLTWIIDSLEYQCPNTSILLASSMLPNGDVKEYGMNNNYENCTMINHEQAQVEIADKYNLGIAKITTMHKEILRYKTYYSMTGNNINHPTDFMIRVYAQNILYALTGKSL